MIAFLLIFASIGLQAQSQTAKAAEDLKFLSQKFANDYLFSLYNPKHFNHLPKLQDTLRSMEENLRIIAKDTRNEDIRSILDYLSYTKDALHDLLNDDIDKENAQKVLDNTDSLIEGVDSILQNLNESIFTKELQYHIMKLSKLYMAIHLQFDPKENVKILYKESHIVDTMLQNINQNIYFTWNAYKRLFTPTPNFFIPHIITIAVDDLEESVSKL